MKLAALESRVEEIVSELAQFHGYRTVWLSERGKLVHAEPEDMLEDRGFRYVATLFQPSREELTAAALEVVPVELDEPLRPAMASWDTPLPSLDGNLVAAL
ncbi:hypothetical protein ENSA5_10160 [Enhygromyxa salina]|uniref:Uncharacterized protein n=1 Tax=Enhygromyxa salina TaxID=215803 RepID=A0A2S9YGE9_9BACT|nr:hypothetical protein [Enhygromyxa salina]PRQ04178.1 hypothetical protein ENSA5_10160 [Enhygromyxa salina]